MQKNHDYSAIGKKGAAARNAKMTAEQRSAVARLGGIAGRDDGKDFAAMGRKGGAMRTGPRGPRKPKG